MVGTLRFAHPTTLRSASRRAYGREEFLHRDLEVGAFAGERLRGREHLRGGGPGGAGAAADVADVARDLRGALGGMLNAARDLLHGGALLLDRARDGGGDRLDLVDGRADVLDGGDRVGGRALNLGDLDRYLL